MSDDRSKSDDEKPKPDEKKAAGGRARALVLTPERKREIARRAATARWGEKPLRATHRGNFKDDFGIDVDCFVLDDDNHTAVISQRGMGLAVGLGEGGSRLPRFINGSRFAPYAGPELTEKLSKPLIFQRDAVGHTNPPGDVYGYDVTILIDLCKAIISAEEAGALTHANVIKQAHVILNASAKAGIKGLVYALAGYDATIAEVIAAFKFYIREEARGYEKEFPDQLYAEWYRLYQLPKPERNKPFKFKYLTIDHVYHPLAKSGGRILSLARAQKAQGQDRSKRLHQFLSEIGVKALRLHLGQLLGLALASSDRAEYERHVERVFGEQLRLSWDW